jgi:hypothetical protein
MPEVSLTDFVKQCENCVKLCSKHADRIVTDQGIVPISFKSHYDTMAANKRDDAMNTCTSFCQTMYEKCKPVVEYEANPKTFRLNGEVVDEKQFRRLDMDCTRSATKLSGYLFSLANRPTKLIFERYDSSLETNETKQM